MFKTLGCDYLPMRKVELSKAIKRTIKKLSAIDFDTIVYSGHSGSLVSVPVAISMGKELTLIRKAYDRSHSVSMIEGVCPKKFVIVDDCIQTGDTIRRILKKVDKLSVGKRYPHFKGVYLYNERDFLEPEELFCSYGIEVRNIKIT